NAGERPNHRRRERAHRSGAPRSPRERTRGLPSREGVRPSRSVLSATRHRPHARPAPRGRLGIRVSRRDPHGRRSREAAARQARRRGREDRDGLGSWIQVGGSDLVMPRSIATRLFLSYLAVVVVGLAVAAITISALLLRYEDDQTRVHLEELSAPFLTAIQTGVRAGQQPREIVDALTEQAHAANARLLITT